MLAFKSHSPTHPNPFRIPITTKPLKPSFQFLRIQTHNFSYLQLKSNSRTGVNAQFSEESKINGGEEEDLKEKGDRVGLSWSELLLSRDRDNVMAVGLTGALAWASLQVLWKLFVVTMATFIAGIKYTFVGALLIFILVTLL